MKTAPSALITFMSSNPGQIWKAELYTFTLLGGQTLYLTGHDADIVYGGHTFSSMGPYMTMHNCKQSIGLSVDSISIDVTAAPTHQINTVPFIQAVVQGILDGATVLVQRMVGAFPGDTSLGVYIKFAGFVSNITDIGISSCTLEVKPKTERLNQNMPRNLIQPGCRHVLFDNGCTLLASTFHQSGVVQAGSTVITVNSGLSQAGTMNPPAAPTLTDHDPGGGVNLPARMYFAVVTYTNVLGETIASFESSLAMAANHVLKVSSPSSFSGATGWNVYVSEAPGSEVKQNTSVIAIGTDWTMPNDGPSSIGGTPPIIPTDGYFAEGWVQFTSGVNSGVARMVLSYGGGTLTVIPGLPFAPVAGDTFDIYPGCDKQQSTCSGKFNNLINFGGQPYVPVPEVGI